jgi:hypothetical protein
MAYWIFMKLYTFVVHYLQMCMKEYGCCPKFKRGDYNCVKFHKNSISSLVGVALTKYMPFPFRESIS